MARDSMDDELLRIRRQSRRNRMIAVMIGAIPVLATCFFCTYPVAREVIGDRFEEHFALTAEQVADARAAIESARRAAREDDAAFHAALPTLGGLAARGDLGGCPYTLSSDLPWESGAFLVSPFPVHEVAPGSEASVGPTSAIGSVELRASSVERGIAEPTTQSDHPSYVLGEAHGATSVIGPEVVFVVHDRRQGFGTLGAAGLSEFTSGYVRGTAYLWVPSARRFACAADVLAENSESVEFTGHVGGFGYEGTDHASLSQAIEQDLQVQTWRAIARGMVAIGPRMTEQEVLDALGEAMGETGDP